ncbi:MAG: thermonuclease family protein [Calditrichia bacterium]
MEHTKYHYQAIVTSVYDGDTCTVDIDLGFSMWIKGEKLRLFRINAPEIRGAEREKGLVSRDFLRELIDGKEILVETIKDKKGKYGRYLAEIWLETPGGWLNINTHLVENGQAVFAEY